MINRLSIRQNFAGAIVGLLLALFLPVASSRAQISPVQHRRMENRFLFVIDTSSAMKSRSDGVEQAVGQLIASGMKGELRKGDTIGLWTYSDRLSTDFPMQVWSEKKQDQILSDLREHVHGLVYEKRAHLDKAWQTIHQVVASSERLTLILIFDGAEPIKGTMFDKDINKLHKQYAGEFRSAHEPIVTVLAARNGAIFDYTINYPASVMLPHMADPLPPPPETNEPPPLVVAPPPPSEVTSPPPHRIEINLTGADFPHTARPPPAVTPAPPVVSNVEVAATPAPATQPVPTNAPPSAVTPTVAPAPQPLTAVNTNVAPAEAGPPPPSSGAPPPAASGSPALAKPPPVAPAPGPAAVVPVAAPASQPVAMLVIAFSLLTIAATLVVFVWRWRGRPQPSLISRSIDQSR
jgi:hypothetical protein